MRALVLGNYSILGNVLHEFAHYLPEGSRITVADNFASGQASNSVSNSAHGEQNLQGAKAMLEAQGILLDVRPCNIYDKDTLDHLVEFANPQSVLVLGEVDSQYSEAEDMRIVNLILYLRDYRERTGCTFGVACQINSEANRELIDVTANGDYIVGRHFASLLMTQISQRREMFGLIDTILSSKGFKVYIKKASNYVPIGVPLDLYTVGTAVAARGEIFIGLRQKQGARYCDPVVNPPKYVAGTHELVTYAFGADDYFVVLSSDMDFSG